MDKTKVAVAIFDKHAASYQHKYMDISLYSDSLDLFCQSIQKYHADILDIACGPGNITKYLLQSHPGYNIHGIDLSPNMISLAKINNPGAEFHLMDCRDIGKMKKKYNAVVCSFCLPYLSQKEAAKLINDAARLLKTNGVIYISTMEDDYSNSGFKKASSGDELYMHYHQADYVVATLAENDFKMIDLQRKVYPAPDGTTTTDLLIIAAIFKW